MKKLILALLFINSALAIEPFTEEQIDEKVQEIKEQHSLNSKSEALKYLDEHFISLKVYLSRHSRGYGENVPNGPTYTCSLYPNRNKSIRVSRLTGLREEVHFDYSYKMVVAASYVSEQCAQQLRELATWMLLSEKIRSTLDIFQGNGEISIDDGKLKFDKYQFAPRTLEETDRTISEKWQLEIERIQREIYGVKDGAEKE